MAHLAGSLAAAGYQVAAPSAVARRVPGTIAFGHGPEDFAALGVSVCRPGIGTVTECIAYGVPMVTFSEAPSNPELAHNGRRLAELGVALDLGVNPDPAEVEAAVEAILSPPRHEAMRRAIGGLRKDGLEQAVEFLLTRLEQAT
jgi:UDP-N-acetylglucosamine:LPS N-acetylglucosamine transferase